MGFRAFGGSDGNYLVTWVLQNEWKDPKTPKSPSMPKVPCDSRGRTAKRLFSAFVVFGVAVGEPGAIHLLADASFCEETFLLRFKKFVEEI